MRLNYIWLSLSILILISSCTSRPRLNPYVPKENIKVIYVTKDATASTTQNTAKDYLGVKKAPVSPPKASTVPTILISDIRLEPDPVPVNQAFDFHVKFKADIPGSESNKIATAFDFKVLQDNKILFTSKSYSIKVNNGETNTRTQHMTPVPAKGVYTIKVFVKYKKLLAEKSITLTIK
jgi:hypothetical protein